MIKHFLLISLGLLFSFTAMGADYIAQVKQQMAEAILARQPILAKQLSSYPREKYVGDQVVVELYQNITPTKAEVDKLLEGMNPDGSWRDLGYVNVLGDSGCVDMQHVQRMLSLCIAYRDKTSPYYNNVKLKDAISKSLDNWLSRDFVLYEHTKRRGLKKNFWYNEVGLPRVLGEVCILLGDQLTAQQREAAIKSMQCVRIYGKGQNKIWLAGNVLMRGLLENNADTVSAARDTIVNAVEYDNHDEGIVADYSYQMHGPQQQFGNYGAIFIGDMALWTLTLRDTPWAFSQDKLDIIADFAYNGLARVLWHGRLDVNGLGRQVFRFSQLHKGLYIDMSCYRLALADKKNRDRYLSIVNSNIDGKPIQLGLYHFFNSDQTVMRRPKWMMSVRMSSERTLGGEAAFTDNLKGYYMSDGSTYTYVDGDEYENIQPYEDWHHLSGITAYDTPTPLKHLTYAGYRSQSKYAGHVGNGRLGMTTMNLVRDKLDALKSWVFTDDYVVCLGAGITSPKDSNVITSIDQLRHLSDLQHLTKSGWQKTSDCSVANPKDERFFHGKTGYIVLSGNRLVAKDEERSGSWHDIMTVYPKDMISTGRLVSLWIDHGNKPSNADYAYIVIPASSKDKVAKFDVKDINVIRNDRSVQAVDLAKYKTILISVFQPSELKLPHGIPFHADKGGLYLVDYSKSTTNPTVTYNDPTK